MNTYGELPNYSLLHVYGFTLKDNPHDAVSTVLIRAVPDFSERHV